MACGTLQLSEYELVQRMLEAHTKQERPSNMTAKQIFDNMMDDYNREFWANVAHAAMLYFCEQLGGGTPIEFAEDARPRIN